jgi:hypothetical protein
MIMQNSTTLISAAEATGASEALMPGGAVTHFAITGITSATVAVEGSLDGSNWLVIGTALTANGLVTVANPPKFVRANVSVYVSGTITVKAMF